MKILSVAKNSPAEKAGIRAGDELIAIDQHPIRDVLDYHFFLTEKRIAISLRRDGKDWEAIIEKDRYADIGLDFESFLMDEKKRCSNRCIFCFIDQNPCGMRPTVYFKDDDTRLSFLQGNYVTLTNVSDEELDRIISMRLSPVNVSVHTTNPELRVKMLGNPRAAKILEQLKKLAEGKIEINCQIVLCRGINDGEELARTVQELAAFYPQVQSIAVVPAGLTRHREGLYPIPSFDRESSRKVLDSVANWGEEFYEKFDQRLIYAADEFYLAAEYPFPPEDYYDGYPQLDNGVGLIRCAREEIMEEIRFRAESGAWKALPAKELTIHLATGVAAYDFMCEVCEALHYRLPSVHFHVKAVENRFFGSTVTVAGLITGRDLIDSLRDEKPEILFFPAVALRYDRDLFLDDTSPKDVADALSCRVIPVENGSLLLDEVENLLNER